MTVATTAQTITEREAAQVERANASSATPIVFVHGLWLLPSSWDRWVTLFEEAGYVALTPGWPDDPETVAEAPVMHGMENFPIEELELGVRSYNCLKRVGIETIGDLVVKSENELAAIPNFGKKSIEEVKETLATHGLNLRGDE